MTLYYVNYYVEGTRAEGTRRQTGAARGRQIEQRRCCGAGRGMLLGGRWDAAGSGVRGDAWGARAAATAWCILGASLLSVADSPDSPRRLRSRPLRSRPLRSRSCAPRSTARTPYGFYPLPFYPDTIYPLSFQYEIFCVALHLPKRFTFSHTDGISQDVPHISHQQIRIKL